MMHGSRKELQAAKMIYCGLVLLIDSSGVEAAVNWVLEHMGDPGQYSLSIFSSSIAP